VLHADPAGQLAAGRPGLAGELFVTDLGGVGVDGEVRGPRLVVRDEDPAVDGGSGREVVDDVPQAARIVRLRDRNIDEPGAEPPAGPVFGCVAAAATGVMVPATTASITVLSRRRMSSSWFLARAEPCLRVYGETLVRERG
jgi:hypothetical protein